jgi:hypothetical protein
MISLMDTVSWQNLPSKEQCYRGGRAVTSDVDFKAAEVLPIIGTTKHGNIMMQSHTASRMRTPRMRQAKYATRGNAYARRYIQEDE